MSNYEIPALFPAISGPFEVPWPLTGYSAKKLPTRFSFTATGNGFSVQLEAKLEKPPRFAVRPAKGRVFEDDCLELFVRPQSSGDSFFPAPFYYGWEIGAGGTLLEYRAGIGEEGRRIIGNGSGLSCTDGSGAAPGLEPFHGILHERIAGTLISFDYDWKSGASFSPRISAKSWELDLAIPWADFGLEEAPHGETWYFTVNRIDVSSAPAGENPGLACLHEGIVEPRFHQPDLFVPLYIC